MQEEEGFTVLNISAALHIGQDEKSKLSSASVPFNPFSDDFYC